MQYSIVDYCWLSPHNVPVLFVLWNQQWHHLIDYWHLEVWRIPHSRMLT
jgi:hypothetical protein